MIRARAFAGGVLLLMVAGPALARQSSSQYPDSLRRGVARMVGAAVALASEEAMASGSFRDDEPGQVPDDRLRLLHIPFKHHWRGEDDLWSPFIGAQIARLVVDEHIDLFGKPFDRSRTTAVNASVSGGGEWRISERFRVEPSLTVIHSWVSNRFDYQNPLTRTLYEPVIEDVVVNWDMRALSVEPSATLSFAARASRCRFGSGYTLAYIHTDPLTSSSDLVESAPASASWIGEARVSLARPLPGSLLGRRLELGGEVTRTDLGGDVRRGAGLAHFYELDLKLWFLDPAAASRVPALALVASVTRGEDFQGWSIGISFQAPPD